MNHYKQIRRELNKRMYGDNLLVATLKVIVLAIAICFILDFIGFTAWVLSGQFPVDNFYLGTGTAHLIGLIK